MGNNSTTFSVDHHTGGMLIDGWLPFVALGWFNSPFEYVHESVGDPSLTAESISMWVARGGSLTAEWGKRGHSLFRLGADHVSDAALVLQVTKTRTLSNPRC